MIASLSAEAGEWIGPGAAVMELLDLSKWYIETKNVGELKIGRVKIGQAAKVYFNAFQGEVLDGYITAISPESVTQQGDITYTLIIALNPSSLDLRPGMSAQVEVSVEE
jgi:HlyD family secretion protein